MQVGKWREVHFCPSHRCLEINLWNPPRAKDKRVKCFQGCAVYHSCWWFPLYKTSHFSFQAHFTSIPPTVWTGKERGSNTWAQPGTGCTFPEGGSDLCVSQAGAVNSLVSRTHREGPHLLPLTLSLPTLCFPQPQGQSASSLCPFPLRVPIPGLLNGGEILFKVSDQRQRLGRRPNYFSAWVVQWSPWFHTF